MIKSNLLPILYEEGNVKSEIICIETHPNAKSTVLVGAAYRPDKGGFSNLEKICQSINQINLDNVVFLGDFNFPDVDWDALDAPSAIARYFLEYINNNMLTQLITQPTRGKNILDLVLIDNHDIVQKVYVEEHFSTSDHKMCFVELSIPVPRINHAPRKVYLYSKGDYDSFGKSIRDEDWSFHFDNKSV